MIKGEPANKIMDIPIARMKHGPRWSPSGSPCSRTNAINWEFKKGENKMKKDSVRNSFQKGFQWYKNHIGYELSEREIEEMFPDVDSTAFYQGIEDAKYNDTFRLNK